MPRSETPMAVSASPGTILRKQHLTQAASHVLISTSPHPDGVHVIVTTNSGTWTFRPDELLDFPRRPDGSTVDWSLPDVRPPMAAELHVGDLLPPPDGSTRPTATVIAEDATDSQRATIEMLDRNLLNHWEATRQRVVSITSHPQTIQILQVNTRFVESRGMLRWRILRDERVEFPRSASTSLTAARKKVRPKTFDELQLTGHGPYMDRRSPNDIVMLVDHPTGRGRWPSQLMTGDWYLELTDHLRLVFLRPPGPKTPYDWKDLTFMWLSNNDRHHSDRQWGPGTNFRYDPRNEQTLELVRRCYTAYSDKYAERYEPPKS